VVSRRNRPPVCRRLGCDARCETWQHVCRACWKQVPHALRNRYAEARRLGLGPIKRDLGNQILKLLGRKPAEPDASSQAYARTAAMLGERDDITEHC
jgi:hypothetical protein